MKHATALRRENNQWWILPLLTMLMVALLVGYYLSGRTIDQQNHQSYLNTIGHLEHHNATYSAELLTLNYQRERSLYFANIIARRLLEVMEHLKQLPRWLDTEEVQQLYQEIDQLSHQVEQQVDLGEHYGRARSSYINSLIQLPTLRRRIEMMLSDVTLEGTECREELVLPLLELMDEVEQELLFSNHQLTLLDKLDEFRIHLGTRPLENRHRAKIGNALTHLEIIVTYTAEAQQLLKQVIDGANQLNVDQVRKHYSQFYSHAQQKRDWRNHWIELFAAILLITILVTLERLRRARAELRNWNLHLQQEVEKQTQALDLAKQEAERVIEYAADPLLVVNMNHLIVRFNQAAKTLIGDSDSLLGRPIQTLFQVPQSNSQHAALQFHEDEQWVITAQQHLVPVLRSTSDLFGRSGNKIGEVWSLRNITEVKELHTQIQSYQQAIDRLLLITVSDTKGDIIHANQRFLDRTGYMLEEVLGKNHRLLNSGYHPKSFWKSFWHTIIKGEIWHGEVCNKSKSGEMLWSDSSIAPLYNVEGEMTGYLAVRVDITDRMELREERERQAYEGGIEEISSSILHNIGNAITGAEHQAGEIRVRIGSLGRVVGYLERLSQQQPLPEGEEARLHKLAQTLEQFVHYGEDVLHQQETTFTHIEEIIHAQRQVVQGGTWMSRFELETAIDEVVQLMRNILERYQTELVIDLQQAPVAVTLPKSPFQQMLANLIKNSCESIGEQMMQEEGGEGRITLTLSGEENREGFVLTIQDNGIGIPREKQE